MYSLDDTIAAISTPIGEGGIGIVRLSGPEASRIVARIFAMGKAPIPTRRPLIPYRLHYGHVVDPATGEAVDEVLAVFMPAPRTYTRQDVVEIDGHGGIVPLRRVLELCLQHGARLASPGEFTVRAFLNGRLDLAQAEAVLDIVQARTAAGLRVAVDQLAGRLSGQVRAVRGQLLEVLAYLTALVDFEHEDIPAQDVAGPLAAARERLERLLAGADQGLVYRHGVRTAIVGRPNVGKSSLLNALLRTSRAIVTPIPGTTRDTLEETLNLQGVPVVLVDTAGITEPGDVIERLGVERSRAALAQADLALLVVDGSQPLQDADRQIAAAVGDKPAIVVVNKVDVWGRAFPKSRGRVRSAPRSDGGVAPDGTPLHCVPYYERPGEPPSLLWESPDLWGGREGTADTGERGVKRLLPDAPRVAVSALTGAGLDALEAAIVERVFAGQVLVSDVPLVSSARHKEALARALEHVTAAQATHRQGLPADFVTIDLTAAVDALGEITGETATDDLLATIFSRFCVGK